MEFLHASRKSRDDPFALKTWIGICTLTAAAYVAILVLSPRDTSPAHHPDTAAATQVQPEPPMVAAASTP